MLKFGTDGWRGVIADVFTIGNIGKLSCAIAKYFNDKSADLLKKSVLVVGYDNRFLSPESAEIAARVFADKGFKIVVSKEAIPTPALSVAIKKKKALGGIMITASHNPYKYNGIKVRNEHGVSIEADETRQIEQIAESSGILEVGINEKNVAYEDLNTIYAEEVRKKLDKTVFKSSRMKIAVDSMHGSGSGLLERVLKDSGIKISGIRSERDVLFGGVNPEPIEQNIQMLIDCVKKNKLDLGIALDGDSDRLGMVDEKGKFVNSHAIFAVCLDYLADMRRRKGKVVKTVSGSYLIDRICRKYSLALIETPIGFKHISKEMLKGGVLMGGEESGGLAFENFLEERDGVFTASVVLQCMAESKKSLSGLVDDIHNKYGKSFYARRDIQLPNIVDLAGAYELLKKSYKKVLTGVKEIKDFDGIKFIWNDDSWLLVRFSGTEPVVRVYAESETAVKMQSLLKSGSELASRAIRVF